MYANIFLTLCFLMDNKNKGKTNIFLLKPDDKRKLQSLEHRNKAMESSAATPSESATPLKKTKVGEQLQNNGILKFGDGVHTIDAPLHFVPDCSIVRWKFTRDLRQRFTVVIELPSDVRSKNLMRGAIGDGNSFEVLLKKVKELMDSTVFFKKWLQADNNKVGFYTKHNKVLP